MDAGKIVLKRGDMLILEQGAIAADYDVLAVNGDSFTARCVSYEHAGKEVPQMIGRTVTFACKSVTCAGRNTWRVKND